MRINDEEIEIIGVNNETTNGVVSEYDIRIKEATRECIIDGETKTVNTAWIGGSIVVDANGTSVKHTFRYLDTIRHKKNGEQNSSFKGILSALGYEAEYDTNAKKLVYNKVGVGLIPKLEGKVTFIDINGNTTKTDTFHKTGDATRVRVTSKLSITTGLNKDGDALNFYNELPVSFISTSKAEETDSAIFRVTGVIKDVVNELNTSTGAETGRYIVTLVVPNFFGTDVIDLIMDAEWEGDVDGQTETFHKEDFYVANSDDSFAKIGDTITLSGDYKAVSYGAPAPATSAKKTFGVSKNVRTGFVRNEYIITGGDIESQAYNLDDIKAMLEEMEVRNENDLAEKIKSAKERNANKNSAPAPAATTTSNPFNSGAAPKANPFAGGAGKSRNPFNS